MLNLQVARETSIDTFLSCLNAYLLNKSKTVSWKDFYTIFIIIIIIYFYFRCPSSQCGGDCNSQHLGETGDIEVYQFYPNPHRCREC
jgi:hypothetical protein